MKRTITTKLTAWANRGDRRPLVLLGARQVGKTYTLREFGRSRYRRLHEINFQGAPASFHTAFAADFNPTRILSDLELLLETTIDKQGEEAIFFDEIQECPRALTALKYFYEQLPGIPIMAAASPVP